uniref:Uncharacterized protein n=1 Tax=Glossina austeni TaxID=7395 RepID=A0A1A9V6F3_GLOAU
MMQISVDTRLTVNNFIKLIEKQLQAYPDVSISGYRTKYKNRVHFNAFMTDVHARIHKTKLQQAPSLRITDSENPQHFDPTLPVAKTMANWLSCFDKFQDLYNDGLQRSDFLPFIDLLLNRSKVADVDNGENDVGRARTITHLGRDLKFKSACGRVLNSSFIELYVIAYMRIAGNDYLQLAQVFHTVLIHDSASANITYELSNATIFQAKTTNVSNVFHNFTKCTPIREKV